MDTSSRRNFLKTAGVIAAGSAIACDAGSRDSGASAKVSREMGFDRAVLDSLSDAVLPQSLGPEGRAAAVASFVAWIDNYDPVAEEMHGYGYADVRYLPPDPAPAWRAQLAGLDILAQRSRGKKFGALDVAGRRDLLSVVLRRERTDRLPAPLSANHIALALLSHWAASPSAWNLAMGRDVSPLTCRTLDNLTEPPRPISGRPNNS